MGIVYKVTFNENGKSYIGKTVKTFSSRLLEHLRDVRRGSNTPFHNALRKYGCDYISEILFTSDIDDELYDKEEELILSNNTLSPHGYNIGMGGKSNRVFGMVKVRDKEGNILTIPKTDERYISGELVFFHTGMKRSDETRERQSEVWKEKQKDPNWKHPQTGIKHSAERRRKNSEAQKRRDNTPYQKITDDEVRYILGLWFSDNPNKDPRIGLISGNGRPKSKASIFTHDMAAKFSNVTAAAIGQIISGKTRANIFKEFKEQISNINS